MRLRKTPKLCKKKTKFSYIPLVMFLIGKYISTKLQTFYGFENINPAGAQVF